MPIRPEWRKLYSTPEWRAIRERIIIERAKHRCEHCNQQTGQPYLNKRNKWCTVHLDQNPENNADTNLAALCRACHLAHDRAAHVRHAHETRATRKDAARPLIQEAQL